MADHRLAARVVRFGGPEVVELRREPLAPRPARGKVRVRVTHASLGSTDLLARRGAYLLQPRPGFVPGYDFTGVLEGEAPALGLHAGMRVAGCLPRMGAHATHVEVAPSLLVPLPDGLASHVAAALPLDLLTARRALDLMGLRGGATASSPAPRAGEATPAAGGTAPAAGAPTVFVHGVTGPVGALVAQLAALDGARIVGTASERTRALAEARGIAVVDYRDGDWPVQVRALAPGGVDGAVDHTGAAVVRTVVAPRGRVVRVAFTGRPGRPGRERRDTLLGGPAVFARTFTRPAERLVSIPLLLATQRRAARTMLAEQLALVAAGRLDPPAVRVLPLAEVVAAHRAAERPAPGEKVVLTMTAPD